MTATTRNGFTDSLRQSRLNHITGTSYPATPAGTYLALYIGAMPKSDGTGSTEATGTRPSITLGSPVADGDGGYYITNASAVTGIVLATTSQGTIFAFGIFDASTSGTLLYTGRLPAGFDAAAGATVTIPAGAIRLYTA